MFENAAAKLKTAARVVCWLGIIGSVIRGIIMIVLASKSHTDGSAATFLGLLTIVIGPLASWLLSLVLYVFAEMAEHTAKIDGKMGKDTPAVQQAAPETETEQDRNRKIISDGGWKCTCGKTNYSYVSTCSCGRNKREVLYPKVYKS